MNDSIREQLRAAGLARQQARELRRQAVELTEAAIIAARDSIPVSEMAKELGVTPQAVYEVVRRIERRQP